MNYRNLVSFKNLKIYILRSFIAYKYFKYFFFAMQQDNENWMPLESNPEVINNFIQKMGLKTELFSFQ